MLQTIVRRRALALAITAAAASASIAYAAGGAPLDAHAQGGGGGAPAAAASSGGGSANLHLFTPSSGDRSGIGGAGFFIDLKADMNLPLAGTGLGGPGHATRAGKGKGLTRPR